MTIHYQGHGVTLHHGDCLDVLRTLPDASVDSVVTDPPYGLEFMGKDWDAPWKAEGAHWREASRLPGSHSTNPTPRPQNFGTAGKPFQDWCEQWARECLRVLKPGGHMLAFGGTRTWHRLACAVEDAGFEVRDSIAWLYGSGFPKSLDVSKAIDKQRTEDLAPAAAVARFLVDHMEAFNITRRDICDHFSAENIAQQWTTHWTDGAVKPRVPKWDQWQELRRWLDLPDDMDAEVWRLNGRKGKPGDNFEAREVLSERVAEVKGGSWAEQVGSGRFRLGEKVIQETAPATPAAQTWQGWGTALKPGHEPVVCARKPFNTVPLGEEVDRLHHLIGGLLWLSLSPAKRAELASPSSPAGQHGARCASALVSAATATSPDGFAQTGMCSSPATASTSSSIASSWSSILGALSALTSTSTTSTRSSTTTALTTLSSLLAPLTSPSTMPPCACLTSGSSSSAPSAGSDSTDEWARWLHTLSASVPASAIEGTALVVASALAQVAASLSADQGAASSADPSATTGADASPSPAFEPVVVARKPLAGTVAQSVLTHGTGALNIDGCRISMSNEDRAIVNNRSGAGFGTGDTVGANQGRAAGKFTSAPAGRWPANVVLDEEMARRLDEQSGERSAGGRPASAGITSEPGAANGTMGGAWSGVDRAEREVLDKGGASRFFYVAKAPKGERPVAFRPSCNCETMKPWTGQSQPRDTAGSESAGDRSWNTSTSGSSTTDATSPRGTTSTTETATSSTTTSGTSNSSRSSSTSESTPVANSETASGGSPAPSAANSSPSTSSTGTSARKAGPSTADAGHATSGEWSETSACGRCGAPAKREAHPTVKPLSLMRWLVRLVTPPGGTVLEPFAGSGTTVEACIIEGFDCIAIEKGDEYLPLIMQRIHRRRDPVAAIRQTGDELGLFELDGGVA